MFRQSNVPGGGAAPSLPYRRWSLCITLWLVTLWAPAQTQTHDNTLALPTAIARTLDENPSLEVFAFRRQALEGERETANLRPGQELGFEAEDFAGTGDARTFQGTEFSVSISSVIEIGGKRDARVNVVGNRYQQLEAQRQVEALELFGEVTRRFVLVLAAQNRLVIAEETAQLTEEAFAEVKTLSDAGVAPLADVKRAEAAAGQARLTVSAEQRQFDYLKVALASMWGETTPRFESVEGNLFEFGEAVPFEQLFAKVEQNPAIQIFAAEERLRAAELRLARTQSSTDIRWSVGVRRLQESNDTALTAGFSIPLFSGSRNRSAITAASAASNEVFVRREVALLNMHTQLFNAYTNRAQAILTVESLQSDIIPALADALEETQQAYQRGRYRYLDYLTARQEWVTARRALIDAATATLSYGVEIEQLTAEPLTATHYSAGQDYSGNSQ